MMDRGRCTEDDKSCPCPQHVYKKKREEALDSVRERMLSLEEASEQDANERGTRIVPTLHLASWKGLSRQANPQRDRGSDTTAQCVRRRDQSIQVILKPKIETCPF
jgi:hypothetical protein